MEQKSISFYSNFIKRGLPAALLFLALAVPPSVALAVTLPNDPAICQVALAGEHLPQTNLVPSRISPAQPRMSVWNDDGPMLEQHRVIADVDAATVCPAEG